MGVDETLHHFMIECPAYMDGARYIPPKKIPPRKVPPGKFLLWKIPPTLFRSYVVSELARFARGRIEDSSFTGSRSTAFQNCLLHCFFH